MELSKIKRSLAKGALFGYLRVVLAIPLYLFLTPFILKGIGQELFGVWAINTMVTSIFNVSDFGLKNSVIYYITGQNTTTEDKRKYFHGALSVFAVISPLIVCLIAIFSTAITDTVFNIAPEYRIEAIYTLVVAALSFSARFFATPYQALIEAQQKIYISQKIFLLWMLSNAALTLAALTLSPTIYALGIANLLSNILVLTSFRRYAIKNYTWIWESKKGRLDPQVIRQLFKYGSGIYVANIFFIAREPLIKAIILREFGVSTLAIFEIIFRLSTQLISLINTPLLGGFSAAAILRDRTSEYAQIIRPLVYISLFQFIPAVAITFLFSQEFFALWLGKDMLKLASLFPWVFLAFSLYYSTAPLYRSIEAGGWSNYSGGIQFFVTILTVGLIVLLSGHGEDMIPFALLVPFTLFSLANVISFSRRFPGIQLIRWKHIASMAVPVCLLAYFGHDATLLSKVLYTLVFIMLYISLNALTGGLNIFRLAAQMKRVLRY